LEKEGGSMKREEYAWQISCGLWKSLAKKAPLKDVEMCFLVKNAACKIAFFDDEETGRRESV